MGEPTAGTLFRLLILNLGPSLPPVLQIRGSALLHVNPGRVADSLMG